MMTVHSHIRGVDRNEKYLAKIEGILRAFNKAERTLSKSSKKMEMVDARIIQVEVPARDRGTPTPNSLKIAGSSFSK